MGKKTTSFGWRIKNSLFFILCFIPFLQWIPFFIMNGKIPKKRWLMMGFANIFILALVILLPFLGEAYRTNYRPEKPEGEPRRTDYVTEDYPSASDYFEEGYDYYLIDNYQDTPQYKQYLKDNDAYYETPEYKAYEKALNDYWDSEEYKAYDKELERTRTIGMGMTSVGTALNAISWFVFMILGFFVERYKYLRALEVNKNRDNVYGQLAHRTDLGGASPVANGENAANNQAGVNPIAKSVQSQPEVQKIIQKADQKRQFDIQDNKSEAVTKPHTPARASTAAGQEAKPGRVLPNATIPQTAPVAMVDINIATEEQLMTLPGMKTIDAKKIISYRNSHGGFSTTDEFFEAFEAKPHIMVKMTKSITMSKREEEPVAVNSYSEDRQSTAYGNASEPKRRFDL